jgi:hypothetical protein
MKGSVMSTGDDSPKPESTEALKPEAQDLEGTPQAAAAEEAQQSTLRDLQQDTPANRDQKQICG